MANIEITRSHSLGLDGGREAVERVAQKLEDDIGVDYKWDENTLRFDGQVADGQIDVAADTVEILINLSAFLRPMQSQVKAEAEKYLDHHLQS
jgi:putative polyhydroxyalkanoate system protein